MVGSFVISDNTCEICRSGFQSKCVHAEFVAQTIGTQAEKARIPHADGTLVPTPGQPDDGANGLMAILAAKQLGAERIIAMSRHADRQARARF